MRQNCNHTQERQTYIGEIIRDTQGNSITMSKEMTIVVSQVVQGDLIMRYLQSLTQLTFNSINEVTLAIPQDVRNRITTNTEHVGLLALMQVRGPSSSSPSLPESLLWMCAWLTQNCSLVLICEREGMWIG
jgi:hypothetical protein